MLLCTTHIGQGQQSSLIPFLLHLVCFSLSHFPLFSFMPYLQTLILSAMSTKYEKSMHYLWALRFFAPRFLFHFHQGNTKCNQKNDCPTLLSLSRLSTPPSNLISEAILDPVLPSLWVSPNTVERVRCYTRWCTWLFVGDSVDEHFFFFCPNLTWNPTYEL